MEITRLLHVSRSVVGALDDATTFYSEALGLSVAQRPDLAVPGQWFTVGDSQLHLNARPAGHDPGSGPRPDHVCLGVADLDALLQRLDRRTVSYTIGGSLAGRQVWLRDPAGNVVELQEDP